MSLRLAASSPAARGLALMSGPERAKECGVRRAAIWQTVKQLDYVLEEMGETPQDALHWFSSRLQWANDMATSLQSGTKALQCFDAIGAASEYVDILATLDAFKLRAAQLDSRLRSASLSEDLRCVTGDLISLG